MKLIRAFAILAPFLAALSSAARAASVGPYGYTNDFNAQPPAADWSCLGVAGAAGDITTPAALTTAVEALTASAINAPVAVDSGNPPGAATNATWSSTGGYLQTRPTGVKFIALMGRFVNNTGSDQNAVQVSYSFTEQGLVNEEVNAHMVYFSLTGAANSWTNVPALSLANPGNLATVINTPWPQGTTLYLLWADDDGSPSPDTANQIDNFYIGPLQAAPSIVSFSPLSASVNVGDPVTLTVVATGNPAPSYQWSKIGGGVTNSMANQTNATYTIAAANLGDAGSYFVVITNGLGSVTSAVATLSVAGPALERGWAKDEYWYTANPGVGVFIRNVTNGGGFITSYLATNYSTSPDNTIFQPRLEGASRANEAGDNFTERLSALFYPPTTDNYVFFVNSDDDSALFVSTNSSAANAVLVAQETGWSSPWQWTTASGGLAATKCSATWTDLNNGKPWASGIHLVQGQPYYIALVHHEGNGGDNCEATFMTISEFNASTNTGPALGTYSRFTGNLISSYAPRCSSMSFVQQPASATAPLGGLATFTARGATDSTTAVGDNLDPRNEWTNYVIYQWTKNGIPIPGATGSAYSFGPVSPEDGTAQFACTIRALGYVDSSGNSLWATSGVANLVVAGGVFEPGVALHQYYSSNPGRAAIENNTAGTPTWSMGSTAFAVGDTGVEIADNFSDQLVGFFVPPATGNYVFFCNADDDTDLFLSTDSSATGRRLIAQETTWAAGPLQWGTSHSLPSQVRSDTFVDPTTGSSPNSNGIPLVGGQKYFLQCVHHQGGGSTYSCITYETTADPNYPNPPASGSLSAIRGGQLGTYAPKCSYVTFTNQPQSVTVNLHASATFTAGGITDSTVPFGGEDDWRQYFTNLLQFQWYKSGTLVAGATTSSLTLANVLASDNGASVYCRMRALGYADNAGNTLWATSSIATLNVMNAPYAVSLSVPDRRELYVYFSTNMDAATALDPSRYSINHGVTVTNCSFVAGLGTNGPQSVVRLFVQPALGVFSDFSLSISNVLGAGGLVSILPNPTVMPFQVNYRTLGYLYLSPLPAAQYISAQNNLVLVRFGSISPAAVTNLSNFITVTGSSSGVHGAQTHVASDGRTVICQIATSFVVNEVVTVALNPQVSSGTAPDPYQYQFVVGGHTPDPLIITARGDNPPYQAKEKAFDGDPTTKWLDYIVPNGTTNFSWIQCLFPNNGTLVAGQYALVSASDSPERDPADWNFYGVDASTNLVLLDRQTNRTFTSRGQTNSYTLSSPLAFRGYRLEITRVNNPATATAVQLAELHSIERQGSLLREYWLNIAGTAVSDLTNNASFPASPSGSGQLTTFEAPVNFGVNYGQRVRGFITAPATGPFVFWISSDDDSQLFLSTDATPSNKISIASVSGWTNPREWSKYSSQQSAGINLTAGQKYYVEALHKQGSGGDNLAVGWAMPGQSASAPSQVIPRGVLSPWTGGPLLAKQTLLTPSATTATTGYQGSQTRPLAAILPNNVSIPTDFPQISITARGNPAPDYIWLENVGQNGQMYKMILDTWGNPVFYQRGGARDFKPQKNGTITWATFTAVDNNFNYLRSYGTVNGYSTDDHELVVMPDGTYYLIGGGNESVDMSRYVTGGNTAAAVWDNAIQVFTAADELIFQWRAWDYMNILGQQAFIDLTSASFDFPHMNSIGLDDDGNILLSSRSSSECTKIDRDTGDVIWRLGGAYSTLTFVNDPLNGPRQQHSFQSIGNGHYILFDDGNLHNPSVSRAVEYVVDPVARTATLVWQFRDTPDKYAYYMGNVQRLTNGNTHINWVMSGYPKAVEVDTNGVKQLELSLTPGQDLYRSWRAPWNGVVAVPYLISESYPDNVTLIFNKFGDTNVSYYRIYGGTNSHPTNLLASTPFTLARLSNLQNNQQYYFDVTAVAGDGTESAYSNEEIVMVNLVQPGQNMLLNGDFSAGTNNWIFVTNNTGAGTFNVTTGACWIHITSPGTALTDIQLRQSGLRLIQGKQYYLAFDGTAVGGTHAIDVKLGQDQSPFGIYYTASPTLAPVRQHFVYSFTMANATDLNSRLMFNMGGLARDIVLDNVTVYMAYPSQLTVSLATLPVGLAVSVDGTNYTTPASLTCATNSSHTLSAPTAQLSADGHIQYPFLSWSDGGAQTHIITTSFFDTNYVASFSTRYLLDTAVSPTNSGSVAAVPAGPWYAPNQTVSLTANPSPGFVFASWTGVDTQSNNTAQAVMRSYRSVTATFQPLGPVVIDTSSLTRLPDGRIQFAISTGPGATQATVWGTSLLFGSNWVPLATVPITGGRGLFTENPASTASSGFYRVTAP